MLYNIIVKERAKMDIVLLTTLFIIVSIVSSALRIVQQYEKGVVFRLGKVVGEKEPGLRLVWPIIDRMMKVPLRIVTMPVQSQKIITKDNVSIDVAAVAYYHVIDATKSIVAIQDVYSAVNQIAQTTVRNIVGQFMLDEILSDTVKINLKIKEIIDIHTEVWGVVVSIVEIKDIQLPDTMQRAMAKQAEAEREKRAKIIAAEGEFLSADKLGQAADVIALHPIALQLRNLQVLSEIAVEKNSTIIFPNQFLSTVEDIKNFMASAK
jgi:regulator of protease activity HflC (stomatin/prohibitin superfamily)